MPKRKYRDNTPYERLGRWTNIGPQRAEVQTLADAFAIANFQRKKKRDERARRRRRQEDRAAADDLNRIRQGPHFLNREQQWANERWENAEMTTHDNYRNSYY